jgi:5-methylcytosine-specific restriction enzyme subunit McrC
LEFRRAGRPVFVGDAKYKLTRDGLGRASDYYQLLAYTTVLRVPEGILIYADADNEPPDVLVEVTNSDKRLWTRAISLDCSGREIDQQLKATADWIRASL